MPGSPVDQIEAALSSMQRLASPPKAAGTSGGKTAGRPSTGKAKATKQKTAAKRRRDWFSILVWGTVIVAVGLVLPLVLLLRVSMYGYQGEGLPAWLALAAGVGAATLGTLLYAFVGTRVLGFRPRFSSGVAKGLLALLVVYCGYATLYISAANVKTPAVRATYTELHPLLRLSVSTLVLADDELVVTDGARRPHDYVRMGLPVNEGSLHYAQTDGYVHAVDLRTIGRAEWKNRLMAFYFQALGFRTLRHRGTADHLHVSLGIPEPTPGSLASRLKVW